VNRIPEDPHSRQAWLARWGEQKARQSELAELAEKQPSRPARGDGRRVRLGATFARFIDWAVRRWEPVFDRGLDTYSGGDSPERGAVHGAPYAPSFWHVLPRALRAVGASDEDVLVDYGCGKGRIVHQAAKWPLKRVIGVEISPELASLAQTLVDGHRHEYRCRSIEIVICDAARFQVPDDLTIGYFYEPFRGETLDAVLCNLIESIDRRPRRVHLICVMPSGTWQVFATGRFRLVRELRVTRHHRAAIFESW
jgi:hypothetical protein